MLHRWRLDVGNANADGADAMAGCLGMPPDAVNRPSVVANLERTAAIAAPLLAFPLTDVTEPAPIFAP